MERIWINWDEPLLPAAAEWLVERGRTADDLCDLEGTVCIVPGKRGGRVLLEQLVRQCRGESLHLVPPRIVTPGGMIDVLFRDDAPRAGEAECILAWMRAIEQFDTDALKPLFPQDDAVRELLTRHELAMRIHQLHVDLAGERRTFADAANAAHELDLEAERERWSVLERLHDTYERALDQCGLVDPHRARREAVDSGAHDEQITRIGLIGIAELNRNQRAALAAYDDCAVALIHAPGDEAQCFDECGCVLADAWQTRTLSLDEQQIIVTDTPADQAQAAMDVLGAISEQYATDEVTIGLGDPGLASSLDAAARWTGCSLHHPDGTALTQTAPFRLLAAAADWLTEPRFEFFAALLRHPDLEAWLRRALRERNVDTADFDPAREDWLTLLDSYFTDHLNARLTGNWLGRHARSLKAIHDAVNALLQPFASRSHEPLHEWAGAIRHVLAAVYDNPDPRADGDSQTPSHQPQATALNKDACLAVHDALLTLETVDPALQPTTDAATALRLVLRTARDAMIPAPMRESDIEALGWLELHLDPAPALVLLGVNEGNIPASVTGDAFLPDQLRTKLGLPNNARRLARDAYLLQANARSKAFLRCVSGRRNADGDPLMPSRLLLQCERQQLPPRVRRLTDPKQALRWSRPHGAPQPARSTQFLVPEADPAVPLPASLRVTSFATYLACPFCFWLEHVMRLEAMEDRAVELDPLNFGTLAHAVLQDFGRETTICDSDDAKAIAQFLGERLEARATDRFGDAPVPAVRIQLARLRLRIEAFAAYQASLRSAGWKIVHAEYTLPESASLDIPGEDPMPIRGKIDRIDQHEQTGLHRIIDYKTSESPKTPIEVHRGKKAHENGEWIDLQLPLYRYLAAQHGIGGDAGRDVELGYIVLPKNPVDVGFLPAHWTHERIEDGIDAARNVVRAIRRGEFSRSDDLDPRRFAPFANILHLHSFSEDENGSDEEATS